MKEERKKKKRRVRGPDKRRRKRRLAPGGRPRLGGPGGATADRATVTFLPGTAGEIAALDPTGENKLSRGVRFLFDYWKKRNATD